MNLDTIPYNKLYNAMVALEEADVFNVKTQGFAILKKCVKAKQERVALDLLKFIHIDPSGDDNAVFYWACTYGMTQLVEKLLLDPRVHPDQPCSEEQNAITPLRSACYEGRIDVVKQLLADARVDFQKNQTRAIRNTVEKSHLDVLDLLLKQPDADVSAGHNVALRWAVERCNARILKRILQEPNVDPNDAHENDQSAVQLVLQSDDVTKHIAALVLEDHRSIYTQAQLDEANGVGCGGEKSAYLRTLKPKPLPKPVEEASSKTTENRFELHIYVHVKQE